MKKIKLLASLLALCLLLTSLVGCSKNKDDEPTTSTTEANTESTMTTESVDDGSNTVETNGFSIKYPKTVDTMGNGSFEIVNVQATQLENYVVKIEITSKRLAYPNGQNHGGFDEGFFFLFFDSHMTYLDCIRPNWAGSVECISSDIEYLDPEYKGNGDIDMQSSTSTGKSWKNVYYIVCPSASHIEIISELEIYNSKK